MRTLNSNLGYVLNAGILINVIQVNPKIISARLTGSVTKEYDGNINATLSAGNYNLSGIVAGDIISLNNPTSSIYDTKFIGTNKNITVTGLTISGY